MVNTKKSEPKAYRALTGIDYVNTETGLNNRAEPGDKITHMSDTDVGQEMGDGNIEPWIDLQTDNVRTDDDSHEVYGVTVKHTNDGTELVVREVDTDE